MSLSMVGSFIGGIGLFLLGMSLMTDGLKVAAGNALRSILERWTGTPVRGMLSGALITAIVQSSSAVTVAVIGFVNAGLMGLYQAIMVIYGTNVGTTMTGWLVATVGLNLNIKAFAVPLIGVGMILKMSGVGQRRGALGQALAGFGLFFIGIDILKSAFDGLGDKIQFESLGQYGVLSLVLFVGVGFILTFLMQSSSAATAITLTSVAGGVIPINAAAAMVIGTNIGTTPKAILATIGATSSAKRVAVAHVAFNLGTGLVALFVLPLLLILLGAVGGILGVGSEPATVLALFHTLFNVLGIALMWPLTARMVRMLERRFRTAEEDEARPRHLDHTLVATPSVAIHALAMELARVGTIARRMASQALADQEVSSSELSSDKAVVDGLVDAAGSFANQMQRGTLPPELDNALSDAFQVSSYYTDLADLAVEVADARGSMPPLGQTELMADLERFRGRIIALLDATDVQSENYVPEACEEEQGAIDEEQDRLKMRLLQAGTRGQLAVRPLVAYLDYARDLRRIGEQAEKAARFLAQLHTFKADDARDVPSQAA